MIKILVVDDHVLFRDALVKLINTQGDMKVVAAANEAKEALALCEKNEPDLIIMDIMTDPAPVGIYDISGPNGITVTAQIRQQFPAIKVLIMTGLIDVSLHEAVKKSGAHGFIHKTIHDEHFFNAIRETMAGKYIFPDKNVSLLPFPVSFNDREIKILRLFCQGKNRSEVAGELCISEGLVKSIVTSLLDKTGFDSILRLAIYMTSSGLIMPSIEE